MRTELNLPSSTNVSIFEFGIRLDRECVPAALEQIYKGRRLFNDLVAAMRTIVDEMNRFVLERSGEDAKRISNEIESLSAQFAAAKAITDEPTMKAVAQARRLKWHELSGILKEERKVHRTEIKTRFLDRIGRRSTCDIYQLRCSAVAEGLGWGTANAVLDAALDAFSASIKQGRAPRFSIGEQVLQDT